MNAPKRPLLFALLAGWIGAVAFLTLQPAGRTPPLTLETFLSFTGGERDTADIILNWALFVPGGIVMALVMDRRRALLAACAFTVIIEIIQIAVPGRHPALQDLVFNSLGALSGIVLVYRGLGGWATRTLPALAAVAWLSPVLLLVPMTSDYDLYGQWTPVFGGVAAYEGRIQDVRIDGFTVPSWRTPDNAALSAALVGRRPIEISLEVGPEPVSMAPVFQIADSERLTLLTLGALGPDLLLRGHNPAKFIGLDQPDARWHGAMAGLDSGATVPIVIERGRGSACISVGERTECGLAPTLGDGWGFLLYLEGAPRWMRIVLSLLWTIWLGFVLGACSREHRRAIALGTSLAALGYVASVMSPDVAPNALQAILLAVAAIAGSRLRRPIAELEHRPVLGADRLEVGPSATTRPRRSRLRSSR